VDDKNKTTNQVAEVSAETLTKLASQDADIRQSGLIDIFEQHLPQIPTDYVFKRKDRKFVEDALNVAFDLTGGIPRLTKWGHENYGEFIKLYARLLPEAQKAETGPAVVQVFHGVPPSALDTGDIVDMDDLDDE
jgi:hypothetical protein